MKMFIIVIALLFSNAVFAANVIVTWTAPTECDDGSSIAANCPTTSYEIYAGTSLTGTAYTKVNVSPGPTAVSQMLTNVGAGTRCFFMKTISGTMSSAESNRLCVTVPPSGPKAPFINVTIAIPPAP